MVVYSDYCRCGRYNSIFWLLIQTIVSMVGINRTITVSFGSLFRIFVSVVGIHIGKTITVLLVVFSDDSKCGRYN